MAYMNFNTDTKFWQRLQVQGITTTTAPDASGYVAYDNTYNNGVMSVYEQKVPGEGTGEMAWVPMVYKVQKGTATEGGAVVQNHGVVTIQFPNSGPGEGCSKTTMVANVNATAAANDVTALAIELPEAFDYTNSFLMTTVYVINEKGVITGIVQPTITLYQREDPSLGATRHFINFQFADHAQLAQRFKIMILFHQTANETVEEVIVGITPNDPSWEQAGTNIEERSLTPYSNKDV